MEIQLTTASSDFPCRDRLFGNVSYEETPTINFGNLSLTYDRYLLETGPSDDTMQLETTHDHRRRHNGGSPIGVFYANAQYKCLDLPGGDTTNGNKVWIWDCNGQSNQKWVFAPGTWQIVFAGNPHKCLDTPGEDAVDGNQLQIWDCNGGKYQYWGYDGEAKSIYLSNSEADATFCMDLNGGSTTNGNKVQLWHCNQSPNQQWTFSNPGPSPGPSPPAPGGYWPEFHNPSELQKDPWNEYFVKLYGGTPDKGYPIKMSDFWMFYTNYIPANARRPALLGNCPPMGVKSGDYYTENNMYTPGTSWIWHPYPWDGPPSNVWAEVTHKKDPFGDEQVGAWFLYSEGSGIWYWTGHRKKFGTHEEGWSHFGSSHSQHKNMDMCRNAGNQGYDTILFTQHKDSVNYPCAASAGLLYMNFEIVSTKLVGAYSCCSSGGAPSNIRAGWVGEKRCDCNEGEGVLNCHGAGSLQSQPGLVSETMPVTSRLWRHSTGLLGPHQSQDLGTNKTILV